MNELHWIEISKEALLHNLGQIRKIVGPDVKICACVKANAYGHGIVECARILSEGGADWLAVNSLYEAKTLVENGLNVPIYVMGYTAMEDLGELVKLELRSVVYNRETLEALNRAALKAGKKAAIHLKVETGNNRQGIAMEEIVDFALEASSMQGIELEGLASHFASADEVDQPDYTEEQLERFREADRKLRESGVEIGIRHICNSAATFDKAEAHFEMVRPGGALYGLWTSDEMKAKFSGKYPLRSVLSWKARIAQIRNVPKGEFIGYNCTYRTDKDSKLAIIPVGYYDGYDRGLSNKGVVLINGERAPVRGRVCMNIIIVDVTEIKDVKIEDEVILLGRSDEIGAEDLAQWAGTINYEITTRLNERTPRIVV